MGQRAKGVVLDQDKFVYKNLTKEDILIVSLGGNDIALRPTKKTIMCIASAIALNAVSFGFWKYPWGMGHFENLFGK